MFERFIDSTGLAKLFEADDWWKTLIMYAIIGVLVYLAVVKKFEPLLLLPIAFGMFLANLPGAELMHSEFFFDEYYLKNGVFDPALYQASDFYMKDGELHVKMTTMIKEVINHGGLVDILYLGVKLGIYPSLIFLGVGAMTDFSPLIANPKSLFLGAASQLGVFAAFFFALFLGFAPEEAAAIGIIGGADGPTAIMVTKELAPQLLGAIAIAAYSYMALIPMIQPPFMRLLTTKKERSIVMKPARAVSKLEQVVFPIIVTLLVVLIVPDAAPLVGFLMLGNLFRVSGVTERLSKAAQNELCNIVTIFLGVSVGATASASNFLDEKTLYIIALGLCAFIISTIGGLLLGKFMCWATKGQINPLIGSAGVSAVPMAARVAQDEGRKANPANFLLMHAMGPNVAGVIGSAVAAGVFLMWFAN
ncbi:MAG: sodium ion-translocating decarboxylase subunit beta [Clostridia bacterium]|nr:sodium ion-translocating decarboxylase subunit beta [Clostridia bacterium]